MGWKLAGFELEYGATRSYPIGIDKNIISIKATTTNGLKFLDMTNGWGCEAIVTLNNEN